MVEVINSSKGIYRHIATGFTLHEVYSIDDVVECNGCIACTNDVWVWVAGRDLSLEVKKFGGGMSLEGLARSLMATYGFGNSGMEFSQGQNTEWGGSNSLCVSLPGIYKQAETVSSLRLFGIVTNAAAGRGVSPTLVQDTASLYGSGHVQYRGAWSWKASPTSRNENLRRNGTAFRPASASTFDGTFIGRAMIAIPFHSWAEFKKQWKKSLPNIDESEVAERANHAVSKLSDGVLKSAFGEVPTVFVPVALYSDGTAAVERSCRPRMYTRSDYPRNSDVQYSVFLCPSLPESETGWWMTNPLGLGKGEKQVKVGATPNDALITGVSYEPNSPEKLVSFTAPTWPCSSVGGVELFKILGGLYPRVNAGGDVDITSIVNEAFRHAGCEESLPTKGTNETDDEYNNRITILASETAYDVITTLPCTWQFAGQPAVLTNWLLNSYLDGGDGRMTNACAAILATGHYYAKGRAVKGTVFTPAQSRAAVTVADLSLSVK